MAFNRGDKVEVSSKEEGFLGSYYPAIILSAIGKNEFLVQYMTLLTEDRSRPLREIVDAGDIRPEPPEIPVTRFAILDRVDAYDNDGWWVGTVSGKNGSKYDVYFETSGEEMVYPVAQLRIHQDWINGEWICSQPIHC